MKDLRFANLDNYLLCLIPNEAKCVEFATNKAELTLFGMEHMHINKNIKTDIYNRPMFMSVKVHPLYNDYLGMRDTMLKGTGDALTTYVKQKVNAEGNDERKTRAKCKALASLHVVNIAFVNKQVS